MELFGRRYTLQVGTVKVVGAAGKGLRVSFKVHESLEKDPNTAEIKVYNLSKEHRQALQGKGVPVILSAGYEGSEAVIYSGDSRYINHSSEGPSWVTKIQSGDSESIYAYSRISKSYAAGVSAATVLREAVAATTLNPGNLETALAQVPRGGLVTYSRGYVAHGRAMDVVDTMARSLGFTVSTQRGVLQFLRGGVVPGVAVLLSSSTGLVGSPAYANPEKKKGPTRLLAKSLLQPSIVCGGQVSIQSAEIKGAFKVHKLDHTGDSTGQEWYTSIEVTGL